MSFVIRRPDSFELCHLDDYLAAVAEIMHAICDVYA
jgi:hypothetical protein